MKLAGNVYIIAAASGSGKSSLAAELSKTMPDLVVSISHTTRPIKPGELDGKHYYFVTKEKFRELIDKGDFLEYAEVFGNYYGTSRKIVEKQLLSGKDLILDIDWQGARLARERLPCTSIFLLPPSMSELALRLKSRKRDSDQVIAVRMSLASKEISHYKEFDYVVINDKFEEALGDLQAIVRSKRLALASQLARHHKLIASFLKEA